MKLLNIKFTEEPTHKLEELFDFFGSEIDRINKKIEDVKMYLTWFDNDLKDMVSLTEPKYNELSDQQFGSEIRALINRTIEHKKMLLEYEELVSEITGTQKEIALEIYLRNKNAG